MCKSAAEGGQRCAAHTRPRYEAATFGTQEWDDAAAEHASTPSGELDIAAEAVTATFAEDHERAATFFAALERGRNIRATTADMNDDIRIQELIAEHELRMLIADRKAADIEARHNIDNIPINEWHNRKMCIVDLETTGVDTRTAQIVTVSVLEVYGDPNNPDNVVVREWLTNPGVELPEESVAVHGITTAEVQKNGLPPSYVLRQLNNLIVKQQEANVPIVGFNGTYDMSVAYVESHRHGLTAAETFDPKTLTLIDPLVIDRAANPRISGRKLTAVAKRVAGINEFDAHNSTADCLATAKIAYKQASTLPIRVEPQRLMGWQRSWDERWATEMNDYVMSRGETERRFFPTFANITSAA